MSQQPPRALTRSAGLSSLRTRLILLILMAVVPMALLLVYNALQDRKTAKEQVGREAQTSLARYVAQQDQLIEGSRQLMASVSGLASTGTGANFNQQACNTSLRNLLKELSYYSNLGIATTGGLAACSAAPITGFPSVGELEWFKRVDQSHRFSVGTYEVDPILNVPTLSFGYPILAVDGSIRSMIFITLNSDWFGALETGGRKQTYTLFDSTGRIVLRQPEAPDDIGRLTAEAPDFLAASQEGAGVRALLGEDGVKRLYAFSPVGDASITGLYASFGIPESVAYADVSADLRRNLFVLAVIALAALIALYLANDLLIVRPIHALIDLTRRLSSGDLSARAPMSKERGEVGLLARAFNEMSEGLELRDRQREAVDAQLRESNEQLQCTVADLKRSNADLEQFAYVASHDLQEPLRTVSSYTQLLARRYRNQLDSDADDFIAFTVEGAQRMQTLINDLLTFSRITTKALPPAAVDMNEAVEQVLSSLRLQLEESGGSVTRDPLPAVSGDESQMRQLLQNLIGNALKFHGEKAPHVHVSATRDGDAWLFSVSDNGIGIPPEQRERIFVIFQRLHHRSDYPGTGIGLAICKRIVERHGGRIWVEASPQGGATFCFTLQDTPEELASAA